MITAYVGPYVALVYFTIVIALLADSNGLLQYLDDNHEVSCNRNTIRIINSKHQTSRYA